MKGREAAEPLTSRTPLTMMKKEGRKTSAMADDPTYAHNDRLLPGAVSHHCHRKRRGQWPVTLTGSLTLPHFTHRHRTHP